MPFLMRSTKTQPLPRRRIPVLLASAAAVAGLVGGLTSSSADDAPPAVTPSADVPEASGWKQTTLVEGLEHPWALAFLPDGRKLVTERPGRMKIINGDEIESEVKGVPDVLALGQGGLLDVVLHPDFEDNRYVYLTYSAGTPQANRTTLARGVLNGSSLEDVEVLFEVSPDKAQGQHFGSRMAWLEDGTLLVSIGDGGNPPLQIDGTLARDHGQRKDSHLASIIRLNDDGSVPDDNPFAGDDDAKPELFSIGHRNIQGMVIDRESGRIWVNEHGPLGGDELNLVRGGENHGWPLTTFGADYRSGERFTPHRTLEGKIPPKVVWTPAQAPSGLLLYTGDRFADWNGHLLSGGLLSEEIRLVKLDGEDVVGEETLKIGRRIRDIRQGPDGLIYVLTDHEEGELLRLEPEE